MLQVGIVRSVRPYQRAPGVLEVVWLGLAGVLPYYG
jgi:hypothetical protein